MAFDADGDGKVDVTLSVNDGKQSIHDRRTGTHTVDRNGDGKIDMIWSRRGGEFDRNFDGKVDVSSIYSPTGKVQQALVDEDLDGTFDRKSEPE
ncbi:MAG: hypothetical protein JNK82_31250 [Myxococcaceae bacterium]|nr:hypothetical protein [Myxococcaceae bacterium]